MKKLPVLKVRYIDPELPMLDFKKLGDSGLDLYARMDIFLPAMQQRKVPLNIMLDIPRGYEGQVRMRSGYSTENGVILLNAPGTVDHRYRGEVMAPLISLYKSITIKRGERVCQLVICPVLHEGLIKVIDVEELDETERGAGGFGSTGKF